MKISGIGFHADKGVKLAVNLQPTASVIKIIDLGNEFESKHEFSDAYIFLPVADYGRARRAAAAFNAIMAEPDGELNPSLIQEMETTL